MSVLEYLESQGIDLNASERVWFCGWEDCYINSGGYYDGWAEIDCDTHKRFAEYVVDYLDYIGELSSHQMDHYYYNEPGAVSDTCVKSGSR
jgi:hypothetical protein